MKKTFKYLFEYSSSVYFFEKERLCFNFEDYLILIQFNPLKEDHQEKLALLQKRDNHTLREFSSSNAHAVEKVFEEGSINSITLLYEERKESGEKLQTEAFTYSEPIPIKLFNYIHYLLGFPDLRILDYSLRETNESNLKYQKFLFRHDSIFFEIRIDPSSFSLIPDIIDGLPLKASVSSSKIESYTYFINNSTDNRLLLPLNALKEVSILNTNTKARRLGYLILLSDFFYKVFKVPSNRLGKRFEEYAYVYKKELNTYYNPKGLIQLTKTGNSAKPYLALAEELEWLSKINRVSVPGKKMKVYQELKPQKVGEADNANPFFIKELERLFFLEEILSRDFLYVSLILELLYISPKGEEFAFLNTKFQALLIQRLEFGIKKLKRKKNMEVYWRELNKIKLRIHNWEEPEIYLEHVLMPRLNWLFDLEIVKIEKTKNRLNVYLTENGKLLFKFICIWMNRNRSFLLNSSEYIKSNFIRLYDTIWRGTSTEDKSIELTHNKIKEYIEESFTYFKTLAPNRVTASQALLFTKYKIYLKDDIVIDEISLQTYLKTIGKKFFIYKYQKQYKDGYIQKLTT